MDEERKTVLIFDIENWQGKTSTSFIKALKQFLPQLEFKEFSMASDDEKTQLYTIAVVRHVVIRCEEYLDELKKALIRGNIKDLGRVIVIYFYTNESDAEISDSIFQISTSGRFEFAEIVVMDFIGNYLMCTTGYLSSTPKQTNVEAHEILELKFPSNIKTRSLSAYLRSYYKYFDG